MKIERSAIARCCSVVEMALARRNKDEAYAAIDRAMEELESNGDAVLEDDPLVALPMEMKMVNELERAGCKTVGDALRLYGDGSKFSRRLMEEFKGVIDSTVEIIPISESDLKRSSRVTENEVWMDLKRHLDQLAPHVRDRKSGQLIENAMNEIERLIVGEKEQLSFLEQDEHCFRDAVLSFYHEEDYHFRKEKLARLVGDMVSFSDPLDAFDDMIDIIVEGIVEDE